MRYFYAWAIIMLPYVLFGAEAVPGATAEQWLSDPESAAKAAGATADKLIGMNTGLMAAIGAGAMTVLYAAKALAPAISRFIPVYGALFESVANAGWGMLATKDQKKADEIKEASHNVVSHIAPAVVALRALSPGTLPKEIEDYLSTPIVRAALEHVEQMNKRPL